MVLSAELEMALQRGSDAHFAQITEYLNAGGDVNDVDEHGTSMLTLNLIYEGGDHLDVDMLCLLYTSPSPRDKRQSRMPSSA